MQPRWKEHLATTTATALALVVSLLLLARVWNQLPMFPNWDLLGYMGVAQEWVHDDPEEVHRSTFAAAREELPTEVFLSLVDPRQPVRKARYEDPRAFSEHLAFYRARVLPTLLMKALHASGAPLSQSLWWLHKASLLLTALVVALWLARWIPAWAAILSATLIAHAPPLLSTVIMSTSDGLAALLLVAAVWLQVERRATAAAALLCALSILTRPDSIILVGLWVAALAWLQRRSSPRVSPAALGAWLGVSLLSYFAVQAHAGEYGWWPLFHISFLEKEVFPSQIDPTIDWAAYASTLGERAAQIPGVGYYLQGSGVRGTSYPLVFGAFALMALGLRGRVRGAAERARVAPHSAVLLAMLVAFSLRWFLFPQLWDRFFTPLYLLVPLLCLSMAGTLLQREGEPQAESV